MPNSRIVKTLEARIARTDDGGDLGDPRVGHVGQDDVESVVDVGTVLGFGRPRGDRVGKALALRLPRVVADRRDAAARGGGDEGVGRGHDQPHANHEIMRHDFTSSRIRARRARVPRSSARSRRSLSARAAPATRHTRHLLLGIFRQLSPAGARGALRRPRPRRDAHASGGGRPGSSDGCRRRGGVPRHPEGGARPGDTLEVRLLAMEPRLPYGTNIAAWWGYLYEDFGKERITIYHVDMAAGLARAAFAFDYTTTPRYDQPGIVVPSDEAARRPALSNVVVPLGPHLGVGGVAPREAGRINSIPPGAFGGNIDNWRFGPGAAMYYPVFHRGALYYLGER